MKTLAKRMSFIRTAIISTLLFVSMLAFAEKGSAEVAVQRTLTLQMENAKFTEVLSELRKESGYEVLYDESSVKGVKNLSLNLKKVSLDEALAQISKLTNLKLNIVNHTIVVGNHSTEKRVGTPSKSVNEGRKITGKVSDVNGDPLIGVNVVVQGTNNGVITDLNGEYSLSVSKENVTLSFSYIGYITQNIKVGKLQKIDVLLKEDSQTLEEVVVVGYGVQKKRDMTGAISSIKSKDIIAIPTTNVLETLQGKVAGMDLINTSGAAGSQPSFTVRGERSLTASNAPLILVDGIDYGTSIDINPSDIESIEVLKDASSTAIYGTRGANGIIIITTKKGKEGKAKISLNTFVSSSMISAYPDIMNAQQYANLKREAYRNHSTNEYVDDTAVFAPEELEYLKAGYDTDYGDLLMHNGFNQSYEMSVSGGSKSTQYNISLGYRGENGLFKDDDYKRYNGRVALDQQLTDNVKMGVNLIYSFKDKNNRYSPMNTANKTVPISKPYDDEGNLVTYPSPGYNTQMNPLIDDQKGMRKDNTTTDRFFGSIYVNWNIMKNLLFRTTLGVDAQGIRNGFYCAKGSLQGGDVDSQSSKEHTITRNITWENVLTYNKEFGIHGFEAMAGTSTIMNRSEYTYAGGKDQTYGGNEFNNLYSNSKEVTIKSSLTESQLASFFGRINYKLMDRYLLTASLRADGSSVFATGNKWGYFPSVALAWRVNDEAFLKDIEAVSNLKLRLSWGESGQCAISPYQTVGSLGTSTYSFNNEAAYGLYPKTMSNSKLTWETTSSYNVGLDFGFFNNRISGSIDVYSSETRNILMSRIIPCTNGYTNVMENIGKTGNKGIDIMLSTRNIQTKDLTWNTDITISHNKEKIKELASGALKDEANSWFVGEPFKVFYDYKKVGIWQTSEATEAAKNGQLPGEIKVADSDGDGSITTEDRIIYSKRPKVTFGINNTFDYKGIDLSFFIYARLGQWIDYTYNSIYSISGMYGGANVDYWTPENASNAFPRPDKGKTAYNTLYFNTLKYEDGSFVKIRDITLGYTLPKNIISHIGLSKLRVYATAKNFFTFSKIDDYDPEMGGSINFPLTKQLVFGINLDF
ncbi:MAG: collagen-binding protein [Bacteroidetes bacterium]|nr:collagen-binding protein [Bacteroidota bacterium]